MATRYVYVLMTIAGLFTACAVVAASGNAREHNPTAALEASKSLPEVAELLEWHSGASSAKFYVSPRWNSSLRQFDTEESAPLLRMHGAPGFQDLAQEEFRPTGGYSSIPVDFRDFVQHPIRHNR